MLKPILIGSAAKAGADSKTQLSARIRHKTPRIEVRTWFPPPRLSFAASVPLGGCAVQSLVARVEKARFTRVFNALWRKRSVTRERAPGLRGVDAAPPGLPGEPLVLRQRAAG